MTTLSSSKIKVPVFETERLRVRGHRLDDFDACVAMWADPIVTKHIGGQPNSEQQTWSRLLTYRGHWDLMGFGYWALEEKASGVFVGEMGFANFRRGIESIKDYPELGWALAPRFHGLGIATEAVKGALAWGEGHFRSVLGSTRTVCIISPENLASIRVAEKCGFKEFERTTYKDSPTILFLR